MGERSPFRLTGTVAPETNVLSPSDLTYLGMFNLPNTGGNANRFVSADHQGLFGMITGRRRSGVTTLLLQNGDSHSGAPVGMSEVEIPAENTLTNDPATAPIATVLRNWVNCWDGVYQVPNPDVNSPVIAGISYLGNRGNGEEVAFTWASAYGDPGQMRNVGLLIINDDGTWDNNGPWGTSVGWEASNGVFAPVPDSVQSDTGCGPWAMIDGIAGNQSGTPAGCNLRACQLPAFTAPPDPTNADTTITSFQTGIWHGRQTPQARPSGTTDDVYAAFSGTPNEGWVEADGNCPSGIRAISAYAPYFGGNNPGEWDNVQTYLDWITDGVWINGPTKQGVLFNGQLVEKPTIAKGFTFDAVYGGYTFNLSPPPVVVRTSAYHLETDKCMEWYGSNINCYGHYAPNNAASGPGSDDLIAWGFIYDPADISAVLRGDVAPDAISPAHTFRYFQQYGLTPLFQEMQTYRQYRTWFDINTKRLYMVEQYRVSGAIPVVHVIAVDC